MECCLKSLRTAGCQQFTPIVPAQEAEIRKIKSHPGKYFSRPYLKNTHHKKGLAEWPK
jgi:hypothetical protein